METLSRKQILLGNKEELVNIVQKLQEESERLRKYRQELLVFLYDPAMPFDNNGSERAIHIGVIHRKISNGSRSEAGAKRFRILLSVIEALKKRGEHVFDSLVDRLGGSFITDVLEPETHVSGCLKQELRFHKGI